MIVTDIKYHFNKHQKVPKTYNEPSLISSATDNHKIIQQSTNIVDSIFVKQNKYKYTCHHSDLGLCRAFYHVQNHLQIAR